MLKFILWAKKATYLQDLLGKGKDYIDFEDSNLADSLYLELENEFTAFIQTLKKHI